MNGSSHRPSSRRARRSQHHLTVSHLERGALSLGTIVALYAIWLGIGLPGLPLTSPHAARGGDDALFANLPEQTARTPARLPTPVARRSPTQRAARRSARRHSVLATLRRPLPPPSAATASEERIAASGAASPAAAERTVAAPPATPERAPLPQTPTPPEPSAPGGGATVQAVGDTISSVLDAATPALPPGPDGQPLVPAEPQLPAVAPSAPPVGEPQLPVQP